MNRYAIVVTREDDGRHSASVPALPGCHTWGDSYDHAVSMAHEAIGLYLEDLRAHREPARAATSVAVTTVEVG